MKKVFPGFPALFVMSAGTKRSTKTLYGDPRNPEDAYSGLSAAFVNQLKEKFAKSDRAYFAYTLAAVEDFLILREFARQRESTPTGWSRPAPRVRLCSSPVTRCQTITPGFPKRGFLETAAEKRRGKKRVFTC